MLSSSAGVGALPLLYDRNLPPWLLPGAGHGHSSHGGRTGSNKTSSEPKTSWKE